MPNLKPESHPSAKSRVAKCFLTFGYVGLFPVMPGTMGSLAALIPVFLLHLFFSYLVVQTVLAIGIILFLFLGVVACRDYALPLFGKEDPSSVVIDEVVGMWIAIWLWNYTPAIGGNMGGKVDLEGLGIPLLAFLLFRFFDITKIGGIRRLEKVPKGWGVMLDDVAAGILAFVIVRIWEWVG